MSRPGKRRPQILIGAVGVGKTAVLVKVVEMLAQSGKIPVVLRLRDLQTDSDFLSVARQRFGEQIDNDIRSAGEADRVWRRLRAQDKIVVLGDDEQEFGTPDAIDRAELRVWLLDEWKDALIEGYEHQDYVLDRPCRKATIEVLPALACIGLEQDRLEVRFEDLVGQPRIQDFDTGRSKAPFRDEPRHREVVEKLRENLKENGHPELYDDLGMAATMGAELGVVEAYDDRVRFRHSLIQAYLGSGYLDEALQDDRYKQEAFYDPGREFLMALVFHSRSTSPAGSNGTPDANEVVEKLKNRIPVDFTKVSPGDRRSMRRSGENSTPG
ncbi:hypothetical protein IU449_04495 [Nocardia higoensis]|uniref:NACHT domain-containing protein n=1 Tax=Nocardia higoensis TaxID=228599 RepID=A0ABS0D642_9NOCA|nr:hypothetical protein [Nocardia higoensis]MBF6353816.1 hypothetical protein [Nocardia higoensis]